MSTIRTIKAERVEVQGFSPKALNPALTLVLIGLVLVIAGALVGDETLRVLGYGALGGVLPSFGVAVASRAGDIQIASAPGTEEAP